MLEKVTKARQALHGLPLEQALEEATRHLQAAVRTLPPASKEDRIALASQVRELGALLNGIEWELDLRARWLESRGAIEIEGYDHYQLVERTHTVITG